MNKVKMKVSLRMSAVHSRVAPNSMYYPGESTFPHWRASSYQDGPLRSSGMHLNEPMTQSNGSLGQLLEQYRLGSVIGSNSMADNVNSGCKRSKRFVTKHKLPLHSIHHKEEHIVVLQRSPSSFTIRKQRLINYGGMPGGTLDTPLLHRRMSVKNSPKSLGKGSL